MPYTEKPQLIHLMRLLDDTDTRMQPIIQKELLHHSVDIVLYKNRLFSHVPDASLESVQKVIVQNKDNLSLSAFKQLLEQPGDEVDLEKLMGILSFWNDPYTDYLEIKEFLDRLAAEINTFLPSSGHPLVFLDHLNFIFFTRYKFRGNQTDYYNPENLFLDRVIKTRRGIPISLSILYVLIAQRLNLPIIGVPMPMHFLLKFYNGEDEIFFDAFHEGKIYSRQECLRFLENAHHHDPEAVLQGCDFKEMIARVLRNLRIIYSSYEPAPQKKDFVNALLALLND